MDLTQSPEGGLDLETDRLLLRAWRVADAEVLRTLWLERDPRVPPHRRISADGHPSLEEIRDQIRNDDGQPFPGTLVVGLKNSHHVIGYCGLIPNRYGQPGEPELACELLRSNWGLGYATEAALAVVEQARLIGYPRLWATVRRWNVASRHVLAKLGFVETGRVEPDEVHGDSIFTSKPLAT